MVRIKSAAECSLTGPVVVGGVGGSGTRVIFKLLSELGFYLGQDLNPAGDNLWFTVLFQRPRWFETVSEQNPKQIDKNLELFKKLMTTNTALTNRELTLFFKAAHQYYRQITRSLARVTTRMRKVSQRREMDFPNFIGWGWKEPNSFIYLKYLSRFFKNLKFIFVIRHGLDMAFAARNQYRFWAHFFGLDQQKGWQNFPLPFKKLEYWRVANTFAIDQGQRWLGNGFWIINFDTLCKKPKEAIDNLVSFLDMDRKKINCSELYNIPKIPGSMNRFKHHDLSIFSRDQWEAVHQFGFETDANGF